MTLDRLLGGAYGDYRRVRGNVNSADTPYCMYSTESVEEACKVDELLRE